MNDMLTIGRGILAAQPFSVDQGTEMIDFAPGQVTLRLPITEQHKQQHGFVHGGVIAYLADNALTFAGGSVLGDGLTLEMKLNYMRPGVGAALIAKAEVLSSGKSQAVCRCDVFAEDDSGTQKLIAAAQGTIAKPPSK